MIVAHLGAVGADVSARPKRLTTTAFPPYAYVPGVHPHPFRSPAGHSFGRIATEPPVIDADAWRSHEAWCWGIDLYDNLHFWEAHEAWEGIWHAHRRVGDVADLLKALIQLSAAQLKIIQDAPNGVRTLSERALRALDGLRDRQAIWCGLDLSVLCADTRRWFAEISRAAEFPRFPFLRVIEANA